MAYMVNSWRAWIGVDEQLPPVEGTLAESVPLRFHTSTLACPVEGPISDAGPTRYLFHLVSFRRSGGQVVAEELDGIVSGGAVFFVVGHQQIARHVRRGALPDHSGASVLRGVDKPVGERCWRG